MCTGLDRPLIVAGYLLAVLQLRFSGLGAFATGAGVTGVGCRVLGSALFPDEPPSGRSQRPCWAVCDGSMRPSSYFKAPVQSSAYARYLVYRSP